MRAPFFQPPDRTYIPKQDKVPESVVARHDTSRQMVGEPALRTIYKKGAVRMPVCPACGMELGAGEPHRDVELGKNPIEGLLLAGMVVTYRYHEKCQDVSWERLMQRTVRALGIAVL